MARNLVQLRTLRPGERFYDVNGPSSLAGIEYMVLAAPRLAGDDNRTVTPLTGSAAGALYHLYGRYQVAVEAAPERGERS